MDVVDGGDAGPSLLFFLFIDLIHPPPPPSSPSVVSVLSLLKFEKMWSSCGRLDAAGEGMHMKEVSGLGFFCWQNKIFLGVYFCIFFT